MANAGPRAPFLIQIQILSLALAGLSWAQPKRPNVVLFLADDMGFSDIGSYGSEIATPNLDRLASNGVRFTQFYNGSRCCPTRAALLTGLYSHQAGVGHMTDRDETATKGPGYAGGLNNKCITLAEVLKTAGYSTYMVGKWHVSFMGAKDNSQWPMQRGFDRFFGFLKGPGQYFESQAMMNGNNPFPMRNGSYTTYHVSDTAASFIDQHAASGRTNPFFLYVAHNAPHWPLQAPDSLVAKYRGKYMQGWSTLRTERYARQRASGLVDSNWALSKDDGLGWDTLSTARKREMDLRMAIYAAQVEAMDQGIGTVLNSLDRNRLSGNTLVLFLSDNGGNWEGGMIGAGPATDLGKHATSPNLSYGQSWGNASNTPFREYKSYEFEGGISTPFIAYWPGGIASGNRWVKNPGHIIDIMPTLVEMAGAVYPRSFKGNTIPPMEGVSLAPAFSGAPIARLQPLFWEHEGKRAVREGKWKLVALKGQPWELYDMEADRTELDNLAAENPDRVKAMTALWNAWAVRAQVVQTPTDIQAMGDARAPSPVAGKTLGDKTGDRVLVNGVLPGKRPPAVPARGILLPIRIEK